MTYVLCMTVVISSGIVIGSVMIGFIGAFGYYFCLTGFLFAHGKSNLKTSVQKGVVIAGALLNLYMLYFAIETFMSGDINSGIIFSVFTFIFFATSIPDVMQYVLLRPVKKMYNHKMNWYFEHFKRMYISYIMATTAFTVIQNIFPIAIMNWLVPTALGTIFIFISVRQQKAKMKIV
ncbi:MAG: hypothetical protein IPP29_23445 [Bacteroidetes bacterium]|nr:hypothetical protein [Bacteroidota bacterium]